MLGLGRRRARLGRRSSSLLGMPSSGHVRRIRRACRQRTSIAKPRVACRWKKPPRFRLAGLTAYRATFVRGRLQPRRNGPHHRRRRRRSDVRVDLCQARARARHRDVEQRREARAGPRARRRRDAELPHDGRLAQAGARRRPDRPRGRFLGRRHASRSARRRAPGRTDRRLRRHGGRSDDSHVSALLEARGSARHVHGKPARLRRDARASSKKTRRSNPPSTASTRSKTSSPPSNACKKPVSSGRSFCASLG